MYGVMEGKTRKLSFGNFEISCNFKVTHESKCVMRPAELQLGGKRSANLRPDRNQLSNAEQK